MRRSRATRRRAGRRKHRRPALAGILLATTLLGGLLLVLAGGSRLVEDEHARRAFEELGQAAGPKEESMDDDATDDAPDWATLRAINPDVAAWLTVDGTTIDYPVVTAHDGDMGWYLRHAFDGSEDGSGCPFLDSACTAGESAVVVYGHSCWPRTDLMFSPLRSAYTPEGFATIGELSWWTPEAGRQRLTPLCSTSISEHTTTGELLPCSTSTEDLQAFLVRLCEEATVRTSGWERSASDARRYILLATCSAIGGERTITVFVSDQPPQVVGTLPPGS